MKKVKLFTTIASLCLAVALMAFGVYAATLDTLNVSGSIKFESTTADGYFSKIEIIELTDCTLTGDASKEASAVNTNVADWTGIQLEVDESKNTASFVVKATYVNVGTTKDISVAVAGDTNKTGVENKSTIAYAADNAVRAYAADNVTAENLGTVTISIKVTFTATDTAQSSTPDWGVTFTAADVA